MIPCKIMDLRGFPSSSSSFFLEDIPLPTQRDVELWKPDIMPDQHGMGSEIDSSTLEKNVAVEFQLQKLPDHPRSVLLHEHKMSCSLNMHAMGVERAVDQSTLTAPINHVPATKSTSREQISSFLAEHGPADMMATQYESNLFSSSLSELINRKLKISSNSVLYGHSVNSLAANFEEEAPFEYLAESETQTTGNLPSDDGLFTGVTDGVYDVNQTSGGDGVEELDFFSSIGGMDLGDDSCITQNDSHFPGGVSNSQLGVDGALITGEHPYGEHPSRKLFVRNINSGVEDSELRDLFKRYGDICRVYTACKHRGFVIIYYFDIRAASYAMRDLQNRLLRHQKLDIHYSVPKDNVSEENFDLDTLVFELDPTASNNELLQTFGVYGEIKEIREKGSHHKLIEFFDIRAAKAAFQALNRGDIRGKHVKLEPSQPCGSRKCFLQQTPSKLEQDKCGLYLQQSSPSNNSVTGFSAGRQIGFAEPGNPLIPQDQLKRDVQGTTNIIPCTFPEYHNGLNDDIHQYAAGTMSAGINFCPTERINNGQLPRVCAKGHPIEFNDGPFGSAGNGSCSLHGCHYTWSNSYCSEPLGMMWPNSPSFVNGISEAHPTPQLHGLPIAPPAMPNTVFPIDNHCVVSAPTISPFWDRWHAYAGESPESSGFNPGSLESMGISNNSHHSVGFVSQNIFPHVGGDYINLHLPSEVLGVQPLHQRPMMSCGSGKMIPMFSSFNSPIEWPRNRKNEGTINQADKKQYELDIDRIAQGGDSRTTLMIKNIPNKYTSQMLLAAIDEHHKGTYDFIYLPIDFKNKCNVGYAFINMTDPSHILPFYQSINGKKWEKFNSEKVASLAYARIQGKVALIAHFQNSSLMNEDKQCRPILFNTYGPNAGGEVPFPMGVNVRRRPAKRWTMTHEESPARKSTKIGQ